MLKNDWITRVIEDSVSTKQANSSMQTCINHLENKKLYKYYSFSSPYTLSNLTNDTIYLQNPVFFNDPFDCNIGLSVNQFAHVFLPIVFNKIFPNTNKEVIDYFCSWFISDENLLLEEGIIDYLLSISVKNPSFAIIIDILKKKSSISYQELLSLFLEEDVDSLEIIKILLSKLSDGETPFLDAATRQHIMKLLQLIKSIITSVLENTNIKKQQLFELLSSNDDFFVKIKKIAAFAGAEIPEAEISMIYSMLDDGIKIFREELGNQVGIECFTQSPTDVLMWSYYADKHTGICVEYDFSKSLFSLSESFLFPVCYSKKRPLLKLEEIYNPITKQLSHDKVIEIFPSIILSLITKSVEWEREKEWRLISSHIKNDFERSVKFPIISKIITGINISDDNYKIVAKIAKNKGVPIHRTHLKNDRYEINIVDEYNV